MDLAVDLVSQLQRTGTQPRSRDPYQAQGRIGENKATLILTWKQKGFNAVTGGMAWDQRDHNRFRAQGGGRKQCTTKDCGPELIMFFEEKGQGSKPQSGGDFAGGLPVTKYMFSRDEGGIR